MDYNNFIIIFSAPSGCGKSTIIKELLNWKNNIKLSVSATTRGPRNSEKDGVDYNFINKNDFEAKIKKEEFLEYAEVHGNYYGTLKSQVEDKLNSNNEIILDIDWQGARQISDKFDLTKLLKIFILPPSYSELEKRLRWRGTDSDEVIEKRLAKAKEEISHCNEYEYIVVNDDLNRTIEEIKAIITSMKLRNTKQLSLDTYVDDFNNKK